MLLFTALAEAKGAFSLSSALETASVSPTYFQYQYGFASDSDFGVAIAFYYSGAPENTFANALSIGRRISTSVFGWPADVVLFVGAQQFDEKGLQPDSYGISFYPKVYKTFVVPYTSIPLRAGLGLGLNYVTRIPVVEVRDFAPDNSEKLTVYIDYTLQLSLTQLMGKPTGFLSGAVNDIYFGYSILHRSTAFGLFAETGGGVNYMGFGVEFVFR